jgi:dynein heavy chain
LLLRLATAEGSLLDDAELIDVLGNIKLKSSEVGQSLKDAGIKSEEIGQKREEFRPVAARGAVLYFCIVEMAGVNWMYNVSLGQFLELFDKGITDSAPDQINAKRVENIINAMTYLTYRYINRGLFEADKTTFKLMMCMRILMKEEVIHSLDVSLFLKAGGAIDDRNKKFGWMDKKVWDNLIALSKHRFGSDQSNPFFKGVIDSISRNTQDWRSFYESDTPESDEVPDYQEKIHADSMLGGFLHLCLVRCMREDRTMLAANRFIASKLTTKFTEPPDDQIADVYEESSINKPILYLLSTGADPTQMIGDFARTAAHKKFPTKNISMGEAMEGPALAKIKDGFKNGDWVVLNNCHLSLEFMAELENILNPKDVEVHDDFRLFLTCAPVNDFPLGLLQMAIKVTMEPPRGMRAGLARTY